MEVNPIKAIGAHVHNQISKLWNNRSVTLLRKNLLESPYAKPALLVVAALVVALVSVIFVRPQKSEGSGKKPYDGGETPKPAARPTDQEIAKMSLNDQVKHSKWTSVPPTEAKATTVGIDNTQKPKLTIKDRINSPMIIATEPQSNKATTLKAAQAGNKTEMQTKAKELRDKLKVINKEIKKIDTDQGLETYNTNRKLNLDRLDQALKLYGDGKNLDLQFARSSQNKPLTLESQFKSAISAGNPNGLIKIRESLAASELHKLKSDSNAQFLQLRDEVNKVIPLMDEIIGLIKTILENEKK